MVSRTFCESTLPTQFATLVLGKADDRGTIELVNAGHTPVILIENRTVRFIPGTNLPLGMFCATDFTAEKQSIRPGSTLLLYSDGITESTDVSGAEFDLTGLLKKLAPQGTFPLPEILGKIQNSIAEFTSGAQPGDDRTMLALRWVPKGL